MQFSTWWVLTYRVKGTPVCNDPLVNDNTTLNAKIKWLLIKGSCSDRSLTRKIGHCIGYVGILIRHLLSMQ